MRLSFAEVICTIKDDSDEMRGHLEPLGSALS